MKNNDNLRGLKSVYSFTLSQTMKSKSNIVSMVILFVMVLISLPLQNLTGNSVSISPIQTAYVTNESGTELDFDALTAQNAMFSSVSFETAEFDKTSYADHLGDADVYVYIGAPDKSLHRREPYRRKQLPQNRGSGITSDRDFLPDDIGALCFTWPVRTKFLRCGQHECR